MLGSPPRLQALPTPRATYPACHLSQHLTRTDLCPIADLEIRESIVQESTQRSTPFHRQSLVDTMLQDAAFVGRKSTLLRDWIGKMPDSSYERRLKSLIDKGAESRAEIIRVLKPEEVLSCR